MDKDLEQLVIELQKNYDVLRTYKSKKRYYRVRDVECAYQKIIDVSLDFIKKWRLVISDELIDCLFEIIRSCLYIWDELLDFGFNNLDNIKRNIYKLEKVRKEIFDEVL